MGPLFINSPDELQLKHADQKSRIFTNNRVFVYSCYVRENSVNESKGFKSVDGFYAPNVCNVCKHRIEIEWEKYWRDAKRETLTICQTI